MDPPGHPVHDIRTNGWTAEYTSTFDARKGFVRRMIKDIHAVLGLL